jgi:hypothetical protein
MHLKLHLLADSVRALTCNLQPCTQDFKQVMHVLCSNCCSSRGDNAPSLGCHLAEGASLLTTTAAFWVVLCATCSETCLRQHPSSFRTCPECRKRANNPHVNIAMLRMLDAHGRGNDASAASASATSAGQATTALLVGMIYQPYSDYSVQFLFLCQSYLIDICFR